MQNRNGESMINPRSRTAVLIKGFLIAAAVGAFVIEGQAASTQVLSPDGRNSIALQPAEGDISRATYSVGRDGRTLFESAPLGPVLASGGRLSDGAQVVDVEHGKVEDTFAMPWGKTAKVDNRCSYAVVTLESASKLRWQVELRAYDDGIAFRYRLLRQANLNEFQLNEEATEFTAAGAPTALFNTLAGFTTSHESLYERKPLAQLPARQLVDMPLLLTWPEGPAAAITEGRVRQFAGMYLERPSEDHSTLRCRLSPLPSGDGVCVSGRTPHESPWRVVLLADSAGKLLESNLLLCLNEPSEGDFSWVKPGKTTFHWWYGEFEDDYKSADSGEYLARHKAYIDFCARNGIAYHAVSGDGRSWYRQSSNDYATPSADADVRAARPEIHLPEIIAYAKEHGVGVRLWVHWKPLDEHLEEAFSLYESWGVKGLMVDFLDRDDQQMIAFTERMLTSAARHKLHIQIHGSSKYSGEQRTFPNLFNREGVLNLEYLKWSDLCTPQHNVNVAYTRALAGPVDYHLGGFRSAPRADFVPRDRAPLVLGTRCHHMALYVVYENPMPMVADSPSSYEGQTGFQFVADAPTTWDETRFLAGEPGEYVVLARRSGDAWYLGGITNWTPRDVDVPLGFLGAGKYEARLFVDGSMDESRPNDVSTWTQEASADKPLQVSMAPGGGFTAVLRAK